MMRFGNYDSPILLEALGDLLLSTQNPDDQSKRLAARAYLKASYESKDEEARQALREQARECLGMQTVHRIGYQQLSLESLDATFADELADADRWFEALTADEKTWIDEGQDVEAAFARKYYEEPELPWPLDTWVWIAGGAILLNAAWRFRRNRAARRSPAV